MAGLGLLVACSGTGGSPIALDLEGLPHAPLTVTPGRVHVLVFISHECPIANSYAPTLQALAAQWRALPVDLFLVQVDPDLTPQQARLHRQAYDLPGTVLLDPEHRLAQRLEVRRTPEAVVQLPDRTAYRGRIDDQWQGLGSRRQEPQQRDLDAAVQTALAGQSVALPHPPAVGCLLPEPRRRDSAPELRIGR